MRYLSSTIQEARLLRTQGKTYRQINHFLNMKIPKSTLNDWFKHVNLPVNHYELIKELNLKNLIKARIFAKRANSLKRQVFLEKIKQINSPIADMISHKEIAKIALAMLCLGEASKSTRRTSFYFGNSDPQIINTFLELLKRFDSFAIEKIRCTVQCRADQDIVVLERFWMKTTNIPQKLFYKTRIDPRTIGKPTLDKSYKGVLRIDYFDNSMRLELESLSKLIFNRLMVKRGP